MQTLAAIRDQLSRRLELSTNAPMPHPTVGERLSVFINRMLHNPTDQKRSDAGFPRLLFNGKLPRNRRRHRPNVEATADLPTREALQRRIATQFPAAFAEDRTTDDRPQIGTNQLIILLARGPKNTTPADYIAGVRCLEGVKQKIQQLPAASQARVLEAVYDAARYFVREEKQEGWQELEPLDGSLGRGSIGADRSHTIWHALSASIKKSRSEGLPLATFLTAQHKDSMLPDAMKGTISTVPGTTILDTSVQSHINHAVEASVLALETHLGQLAKRPPISEL